MELIWMIDTEDRQVTARRVRTADWEGQARHSKEPSRQQAERADKVSERVGGQTRHGRWVGREPKTNRQGSQCGQDGRQGRQVRKAGKAQRPCKQGKGRLAGSLGR